MKFLAMLATMFSLVFLILVVHAFSFPAQKKAEEIHLLSSSVKDTKPSLGFKSNDYKRFVYAQ